MKEYAKTVRLQVGDRVRTDAGEQGTVIESKHEFPNYEVRIDGIIPRFVMEDVFICRRDYLKLIS